MAKIQSIASANDLKTALGKLPQNGEEDLRFRAVRGKRKGDKEESGGLFVGPQMLGAFTKEKEKFVSAQLFDGAVKRSEHEPGKRLVLVTNSSVGPLTELARSCITQAKLPYKIVVIKPDEAEPVQILDDEESGQKKPPVTGESKTPPVSPSQPPKGENKTAPVGPSQLEMAQLRQKKAALEKHLIDAFPPGGAARVKKVTSKLLVGSGENFTPLITALELVEQERSPSNLADLASAARTYLQHAEKDYSEKDKKDPVNRAKILTAEKILRDLETARQIMAGPTVPELKNTGSEQWENRSEMVRKRLEELGSVPDKEMTEEIGRQYGMAELAAQAGDHGRALSLLDTVERLVDEALKPSTRPPLDELYESEHRKIESTLKLLKTKLLPEKMQPLLTLYSKAIEHGKNGRFAEAIQIMERLRNLGKEAAKVQVWEKSLNLSQYKLFSGESIGEGGFGGVHLLEKPDLNSPGLVLKSFKNEEKLKEEAEMYQKVGNHPNIGRSLGIQTIGGQKGLVLEAINGGQVDQISRKLRAKLQKNEITQEEFWGTVQYTLVGTLQGLEHISDLGYTHMDIKPDNILYDAETGEVKLIDLGIAQDRGQGRGGTWGFMAPESLKGKGDTHTDIFGVGATAFTLGEESKYFDYNSGRKIQPTQKSIQEYGLGDKQALRPGDEKNPTTVLNPQTKKPEKGFGRFGAETEYVKFVNWLLDPDPKKRPTIREALEHPFLKDRSLGDDRAKDLIKGVSLATTLTFQSGSPKSSWEVSENLLLERGLTEELANRFESLLESKASAREQISMLKRHIVDLEDTLYELQQEEEQLNLENEEEEKKAEELKKKIEKLEQEIEENNQLFPTLQETDTGKNEALVQIGEECIKLATDDNAKRFWKGVIEAATHRYNLFD